MSEAKKRCRDYGLILGSMMPGPKNSITDVPGVRVGHTTLSYNDEHGIAQTGVTAIWPGDGDLVREPVPAGSFVLNGFGEITGRPAADDRPDWPVDLASVLPGGLPRFYQLER